MIISTTRPKDPRIGDLWNFIYHSAKLNKTIINTLQYDGIDWLPINSNIEDPDTVDEVEDN